MIDKKRQDRATAYHEAAHAVVCCYYGGRILERGITLEPSYCHTSPFWNEFQIQLAEEGNRHAKAALREGVRASLLTSMAGEIAAYRSVERQLTFSKWFGWDTLEAAYSEVELFEEECGDQHKVAELLLRAYPRTASVGMLEDLWPAVENLVSDLWPVIQELAEQLLSSEAISGEQANETIYSLLDGRSSGPTEPPTFRWTENHIDL